MMRKVILDDIVNDLLSITPLIRRTIQRKLVRTAFAQIEADMSLPHMEIIKTLRDYGTMHIAEIGEKLLIPKPQMTHLIDKLVSLEIIVRQADTSDRRTTNISLTEKGERIIEEFDTVVRDSIQDKLSGLTDEDLKELSVSLQKLGEVFSRL